MSTKSPSFVCRTCGATALRWVGQCPTCREWNTLDEASDEPALSASVADPITLAEVAIDAVEPMSLGIAALDGVMAGGAFPGTVTLVAGAPGIGKSTLCLQAAVFVAGQGRGALVVAAEESTAQVAQRARRLGATPTALEVVATTELADALAVVERTDAALVVVDSVSTLRDSTTKSPSGSVAHVRAAAEQLAALARRRGVALILVGHVTKDGDVAGPRALEHLVDTVVTIEGDRHHQRRIVTTSKHRFGPAGEVGLLEMDVDGLVSIDDPSATLVAERGSALPGSIATVLAEGVRPLVVEIQALVTPSVASPARVAQGVSATRLRQLAAVVDAHCDLGLSRTDLFVACAGAIKATEPAVDVAVVAAMTSAFLGRALPSDVVAIGEVGLTGAIKPVMSGVRRLHEAHRVGLRTALVPSRSEAPRELRSIEVATVADLVAAVSELCTPRTSSGESTSIR